MKGKERKKMRRIKGMHGGAKKKTILVMLFICVLLVGGFLSAKHVRTSMARVDVFPVSMVSGGYYQDPMSMEGMVYDTDSQSIYLESTQTVKTVYVQQGQKVQAGDKLLALDMSAQEITLKLKELELSEAKKQWEKGKKELQDLKNGKMPSTAALSEKTPLIVEDPLWLTASLGEPPMMQGSNGAREMATGDSEQNDQEEDAWVVLDEARVDDYYVLEETEAEVGSEDNPRRYLVTEDGRMFGSFLNALREDFEGYVVIEIREDNRQNGKLLASWTMFSGLLREYEPEEGWFVLTHEPIPREEEEEPSPPNEPEPWEEPEESMPSTEPGSAGFSRQERVQAIREKEQEVQALDLAIRKNQLELKSLRSQMQDEVVVAKKDGVVMSVSDPESPPQDGSPFLKVAAGAGSYIQGNVSELMLQQLTPGSEVTAMNWEDGSVYTGVVSSIDEYPVSRSGYFGGNPNASYYGFLAYFEEADGLRVGDYMALSVEAPTVSEDQLFLERAYVRKDNQGYYVMKEADGLLKKQYVSCGRTYYGEIIEITEGLSMEDYIAFPYGGGTQEGAKTNPTEEMEGLW